MSQGMALEGMRLVKEYLPRAYQDGTDLEARAHMMSAAAMGATAFQKGLGAIHALSHPVGAVYGTHHGTTNAVFMPTVLKFNESAIRDRFDTVADYLSIGRGFVGFCAYVDGLNASLQIPRNLTQLGVGQDRLDELVEMALNDPSCGGNPIELNVKNTREILDNALN
jgi:4-hydroxybutyrate dehydrogenase